MNGSTPTGEKETTGQLCHMLPHWLRLVYLCVEVLLTLFRPQMEGAVWLFSEPENGCCPPPHPPQPPPVFSMLAPQTSPPGKQRTRRRRRRKRRKWTNMYTPYPYPFLRLLIWVRGGRTLHAPIHKGSNLGTGLRKLAGSSVTTYRSSSQPEPDQNSTG